MTPTNKSPVKLENDEEDEVNVQFTFLSNKTQKVPPLSLSNSIE